MFILIDDMEMLCVCVCMSASAAAETVEQRNLWPKKDCRKTLLVESE